MEGNKDVEDQKSMGKNLKDLFSMKRRGTINLADAPDENDELMKRLRAWKLRRKEYEA